MDQEKGALLRRRLQTTLYCQCFSPCGKYLAAADNFGYLSVFDLPAALGPDSTEDALSPIYSFRVYNGSIYSMVSSDVHLVVAGSGPIQAFLWSEILSKNAKVVWEIEIPCVNRFDSVETNSIEVINSDGVNRLFCGCGDNMVHMWDIDSGTKLRSLKGHTDYIHKVLVKNDGRECMSASEDGTVRLWDNRIAGEAMLVIEPYKNNECARPKLGRYITCAALNSADDWLVCGGGPHLSVWHIRSLTPTAVFQTGTTTHQHVMFYQDMLISAGSESNVFHWNIDGNLKSKVPCTPTHVFNVAVNENDESSKVLSIAGNTHKMDVCTNFGYRAFSLSVC